MKKNQDNFEIEKCYDYYSDTLGIRVTNEYNYKESIELKEGLILDFNKDNVPVALEMLDASKLLRIKKSALRNITNIHMKININSDLIRLDLSVTALLRNKPLSATANSMVINEHNIPIADIELATV
ncbi:MAG: DUF2283 domain-containing protein [Methanobrevibacter sp.]|jgi:uncharacterized protein YuzE|nr:DUF2283 domain-containing protein [Candidatus Methanovirga meridionalis]